MNIGDFEPEVQITVFILKPIGDSRVKAQPGLKPLTGRLQLEINIPFSVPDEESSEFVSF